MDKLVVFYIRYWRRWVSIAIRILTVDLCMRYRNIQLPVCRSIGDVTEAMSQVQYEPDMIDYVRSPKKTWATKRGDCEDMAELARALARQFRKDVYILSVICRPKKYSHSVCLLPYGDEFEWIDLRKYQTSRSLGAIINEIARGSRVVCHVLEE